MATTTKKKKSAPAKKSPVKTSIADQETLGKKTDTTKEKIKDLIDLKFDDIVESFEKLTPKQKCDMFVQLLPYVTPRMQSSEVSADVNMEPLTNELGELAGGKVESVIASGIAVEALHS